VKQDSLFPSDEAVASVRFVKPAGMLSALGDAIDVAKGSDVLAPVVVVAPGGRAAQSCSRALARGGGVVNTRFVRLHHFAEQLLLDAGDRRRRVGAELLRELTRLALLDAGENVSGPAGAAHVTAMARAFSDLRMRSDGEVVAIESSGARAAAVVALFRRFLDRLEGRLDKRGLVEAAVSCVHGATSPVVVVVCEPPAFFEYELLERLHRFGLLQVVAVTCGDETLDSALRTSLWGLGVVRDDSSPVRMTSSQASVVVAPDADLEVRIAVSRLLEAAEQGVRFADMALLYPSSGSYGLIVDRVLSDAGVGVRGESTFRLGHSIVGRFTRALLELVERPSSADALVRLVTSAPLRDLRHGGEVIDAGHWVEIGHTCRAFAGSSDDAMQRAAERVELFSATFEATRAGMDATSRVFAEFLRDLRERCVLPAESWAAAVAWLQSMIDDYVGREWSEQGASGVEATWPRREVSAAIALEQGLFGLQTLDVAGGGSVHDAFGPAVRELLGRGLRGGDPAGIFVGTLTDAIGVSGEYVVVCGAAEGVLPARVAVDGISQLLRVPGEELRVDRDRRAFLLALRQFRQVSVTMPRADRRAQQERRPSPWLLELAADLQGEPVAAGDLCDTLDASWLQRVQSFSSWIESEVSFGGEQYRSLHRLVSDSDSGRLDDEHARVVRARDADEWTRFDGVIGSGRVLPVDVWNLSPTALEHWAVCPYRYFLATVLGVDPGPEIDDALDTVARDIGVLFHEALEQFLRQTRKRTSPGQPWTAEEREQLRNIATQLIDDSVQEGRSPRGLLGEVERARIHSQLDAVLDEDERHRRRYGVVTDRADLEKSFVNVELPVGSVPVTFRGRIDRVDRSLDGSRVVAVDYKTGSARKMPALDKDPVAGGVKLQLAAYAEALRRSSPDATIEARYWFTREHEGESAARAIVYDEPSRQRFIEVVATMVDGIEQGAFPPVPGDDGFGGPENCRHCPYDTICPADRVELWERKGSSGPVHTYLDLTGEGGEK
jgi:ATP-dependent helicase/nuclease subunit B